MSVRTQKGFSLVELMVTIVLALLVTDAVVSLFVGVRSASRATSGAGATTDGGRFALNFLEQAVRSTGAMGCASTLSQGSQLTPSIASPMSTDYVEALGGYEAVGTSPAQLYVLAAPPLTADPARGDWVSTATLGGQLDAQLQALVIQGTDVLVVRSTVTGTTPTYTTATAGVGANTISISDATGFTQGNIGVLTNCVSSLAFQLGALSAAAGPATVSMASPLNAQNTLTLGFDAGAQLATVGTRVYFVGRGADGDGALFVATVPADGVTPLAPQELVPDIENLQILYGIDTTGSHVASQYVTADQIALGNSGGANSVVSVRIAVLAASPPQAVPLPTAAQVFTLLGTQIRAPIDTRMRRVFEVTAAARNTST